LVPSGPGLSGRPRRHAPARRCAHPRARLRDVAAAGTLMTSDLARGTTSSRRAGVRLARTRLPRSGWPQQRATGLLRAPRHRSGRRVHRRPRRAYRLQHSLLPHEGRIRRRQRDPVRPMRQDVHPQVRAPLARLCLERVQPRQTLRLLDEGRPRQTIPTARSWPVDSDLGPPQSSCRLHVLHDIRRVNANPRVTEHWPRRTIWRMVVRVGVLAAVACALTGCGASVGTQISGLPRTSLD
jgi:hypothetical protein